MLQLKLWRLQAAKRLGELVPKIQGTTAGAEDGWVDDLLRGLSNLPKRPADKQAYESLFPGVDLPTGRSKAATRLEELVAALTGDSPGASDNLVDDLIRKLSNLPARPGDKQAYASIFPAAKVLEVTANQLLAIAPYADPERVRNLLPYINLAMAEFQINSPLRQAHFLAQVAHESGSFNYMEELASGEDYEGRDDLGNTQPGDGVRFKGRGLIQITGRTNYSNCGGALGVDLISNPTRLADYDLAARSAGWFWDTNTLNTYADRDDVVGATKVINGGTNGLDERINFLEVAKQTFGL